uniref:Uncharacterized protein n=1 Tax=Anopheles epiroticus TaxID=199890 RepID=A0A182PWZ0_9DIPT
SPSIEEPYFARDPIEENSEQESDVDDLQDWVTVDESDENRSESSDENDADRALVNKWASSSFQECIRQWALSTHQTHHALNELLGVFREKTNYRFPKDARTFLKTQKCNEKIIPIAGGDYWCQGIKPCLLSYYRNIQPKVSTFSLSIFIDGLPLHNSGPTQFWPILFNVYELPQIPCMVAAMFCGASKPRSTEQFLRPLVTELNNLTENGFNIAGKLIQVRGNEVILHLNSDFVLRNIERDAWFLTKDEYIVKYQRCIEQSNVIKIYGTHFNEISEPVTYHSSRHM